jgi:hypothetical protein
LSFSIFSLFPHVGKLLKAFKRPKQKRTCIGGAAELLGLKPTTLLSRIKKMGIVRLVSINRKDMNRNGFDSLNRLVS